MANSSEIRKSGLIPASSGTYASNYKISDDTIGKFISLNGARKFYNPGVDLNLSSPNTAPVASSIQLVNTFNDSRSSGLNTNSGNNAFFYIFDTQSPIGDSIPGYVNAPAQIIDVSTRPNQFGLTTVYSEGNHRILNVLTPGEYTISFQANGSIKESAERAFHFDFAFYLNINGTETIISEAIKVANSVYVGGNQINLATLNYNLPLFSQKFTFKTGDYVQLYGKGIGDYNHVTCTVQVNGTLTIELGTTTAPTQSIFTNPLNIADFKTNSINVYGANRDTLILQGTKLTS